MGSETLAILAVMVVILLMITAFGIGEKRRYIAYLKSRIASEYGKRQQKEITPERLDCLPAYFEKHRSSLSIDDITASDLELDRLFCEMNLTYSAAGEEVLYHSLRTPLFDEKEIARRREQIAYFREHAAERAELQLAFANMGKRGRYSIYDYLDFSDTLSERKSLAYHFLAPLLLLAAVGLLFVSAGAGILALIAAIVFNMSWYFKEKNYVQPHVATLKAVIEELKCGEKLLGKSCEALKEEEERLKELLKELSPLKKGAGLIFSGDDRSGDPLEILGDYSNMIFHIDLILFYRIFRQLQDKKEQIDVLHGLMGYVEMLIAVGSYMEALKNCCEVSFDGKESAKELYHPLIEDPVTNDYSLDGCMLLTGSNASGKSTFLKTVAINQLLGQCYGFACASEFHTEFHRIYSSMALRDDLAHSESYFVVEIKAMRRILEAGEEEGPRIACYVDEVLRGTNTIERIAASTRILKSMAERGFLVLAATHDIELCELLEKEYNNYHFEEEIKEGDVLFNYRLQKGKATSRNAIKLLSVMGYDQAIVKEAEALAEHFLKEGNWT
ncbi:MAG: hypothetical protein IK115_06105 [Lachnospiraceae bacterium]|nr:hypothetical protein [Lachnospiraceae bacterium]